MGKYFTIAELCDSTIATKYGIDNTPTAEAISNMEALITNVLDPVRIRYGKPIHTNSGYRCKTLNSHKEVGGSSTSQHLTGEAADITVYSPSLNKQIGLLIAHYLTFDQLIFEYTASAKGSLDCQWVHVSFSRKRNRKEILRKVKGKPEYERITI